MNLIYARTWMSSLLVGTVVSLVVPATAAAQPSLTITLSGLRSQKGNIIVCLWRQQDKGFPMCSKTAAFRQTTVAPTASTVTVGFSNVPSGEYAISAVHDENNNGKVDRGLMGQPKEGIALSNMDLSQGRRGRPSFGKTKLTVNGAKTLSLSFRYF